MPWRPPRGPLPLLLVFLSVVWERVFLLAVYNDAPGLYAVVVLRFLGLLLLSAALFLTLGATRAMLAQHVMLAWLLLTRPRVHAAAACAGSRNAYRRDPYITLFWRSSVPITAASGSYTHILVWPPSTPRRRVWLRATPSGLRPFLPLTRSALRHRCRRLSVWL